MTSFTAAHVNAERLNFDALEAAGCVTFDDTQRERIAHACNTYLQNISLKAAMPNREEVRDSLESIRKRAAALEAIIADPSQSDAMNLALPPGIEPRELMTVLRGIQHQTVASRNQMPEQGGAGGRPPEWARDALIQAVDAVWRGAGGTGNKAYRKHDGGHGGAFLMLMDHLLEQLAQFDSRVHHHRNDGLLRACKNR